ncbi:MAG: hypothetical protein OZ934_04875 [Anaerolineae bacterium]|nr:hypothetical protein [Anaerolineae bacterium]
MSVPVSRPDDPARGALLSDHPHPRPALRRITAVLIALGIAGALVGIVGLLVLGFGYGLPLLVLSVPFLIALVVPLLQLAVLHPRVTVYERGVWLQPLLGRGRWIAWEDIARVAEHTLIRRGQARRRDREHFGQLIVVERGLPPVFMIVGLMAGLGWRARAFGISTHSHVEYEALRRAIVRGARR